MDASCKIQRSIHDVRLTYKYVSRILGTYQSGTPFGLYIRMNRRLNNTLSHHCIYNFFETCNVSTNNEVVWHIITFCSIADLSVDVNHDLMKFGINFFGCPGKSLRVLAHFQCGSSNTTCIGMLFQEGREHRLP